MHELLAYLREDQRHQWEVGSRVPVETYLRLHPELGNDRDAVLDLVYSEVLLREELGEVVDSTEYLRRFPEYEGPLARQFEFHAILRSGASSLTDTAVCDDATPTTPTQAVPEIPGYRFVRVLGEGSWGVVYEAVRTALAHTVAVKVARAGNGASLLREAAAVIRLDHPNVVRVYDAGEHQGREYFTMEVVGGGSLAQRLGSGPLPAAAAAELILGAARGVAAAHAKGIVHRDLKPGNILLSVAGTPKVTDFGLARVADANSSLVESGTLVGSECYMAPEQAVGADDVGPPADVFALGVILHEVLTGRPPFKGANLLDTIHRIRWDPTPAVRGLPKDLDAVRERCLEKQPADRFPSAAELVSELEAFAAGRPITTRRRHVLLRTWRQVRRRPLPVATVLALAAGVALGVLGGPAPSPRPHYDPGPFGPEPDRPDDPAVEQGRINGLLSAGATYGLERPRPLPGPLRWRVGELVPPRWDGENDWVAAETFHLALLEVLANPVVARYELVATVRIDTLPRNRSSRVGLYFGHNTAVLADGGPAWTCYTLSYTETARQGVKQEWATVDCWLDANTGGKNPGLGNGARVAEFQPVALVGRAGPWRTLGVQVGPEGVRVLWEQAPGQFGPVSKIPARQLQGHLASLARGFERTRSVATEFRPGGIGVYFWRCSASIRRITVRPITAENWFDD